MKSLLGRVILVVGFFPFITLNMSCYSLLACRVSAERSAVNLMRIPFYVICCFSLAAFNIFSLYIICDSLINMCLRVFLLGFILYGTLCASWTWLTLSSPILGKFPTITSPPVLKWKIMNSCTCVCYCQTPRGFRKEWPTPLLLLALTTVFLS